MYRGELNPNGVVAVCDGRTAPRCCCGHQSQRRSDCAVPTLGLDEAIPGVEDPYNVQVLTPVGHEEPSKVQLAGTRPCRTAFSRIRPPTSDLRPPSPDLCPLLSAFPTKEDVKLSSCVTTFVTSVTGFVTPYRVEDEISKT